MRRREFIAGLGSAAAWPVLARAQQSAVPVIGYLSADKSGELLRAFHFGLIEGGYVAGQNVALEYRWADGDLNLLPGFAEELVRRRVAVIVALAGARGALAAKAATLSVPVVFVIGVDPVEAGLVASRERPGGNLTGVYVLNAAVAAKRLEVLHELVPAATLIAYLTNPANPIFADSERRELQEAARAAGVRLIIVEASDACEFEGVFTTLVSQRAGALIVGGDLFFANHADQLVALAARHRMPAIYHRHEIVKAGGLISYGPDFSHPWHLAGIYAARVLKGELPGDLPVQQSTRIETVLNLKAAKALGIEVPTSILVRADEVIE
jgi:putative tryptophan/tyrosine transport system substrate-binding protein